jgi:hypothetical protein
MEVCQGPNWGCSAKGKKKCFGLNSHSVLTGPMLEVYRSPPHFLSGITAPASNTKLSACSVTHHAMKMCVKVEI